ncbi:MAG: hypothetical protein JSS23_12305 [Proteobacteria bacterium]|nr:hypothetical protein [Pseudomonadota bacterium]
MPSYDYELPELGGMRVTLIRPVAERDDPIRVIRRTVPDRVSVSGSAQNPVDFDVQYKRGLQQAEARGQLPRDFSAGQLKRAAAIKVD